MSKPLSMSRKSRSLGTFMTVVKLTKLSIAHMSNPINRPRIRLERQSGYSLLLCADGSSSRLQSLLWLSCNQSLST